jgi:hypothetical protein
MFLRKTHTARQAYNNIIYQCSQRTTVLALLPSRKVKELMDAISKRCKQNESNLKRPTITVQEYKAVF